MGADFLFFPGCKLQSPNGENNDLLKWSFIIRIFTKAEFPTSLLSSTFLVKRIK